MKAIQNTLKQIVSKNNSSSILIGHPEEEVRNTVIDELIRGILDIPSSKSYNSLPDVFGIWPEQIEGKTIKIQQVHEFIRKTQLKPFVAQYKVGVISHAEKMTPESQNALLKTIEEPPAGTYLILSTTKHSLLLPTIVSRCRVFDLVEKKTQDEASTDVEDIISADIIKRFQHVENLLSEKDTTKKQETISELLHQLLLHFRIRLEKESSQNTDSDDTIKKIQLIENTRKAIEKNVSQRLALENLMINL